MGWLILVGGLVLLTAGAELLLRGASALAARIGLSQLVIGLTVVAFGTSAPELAVSVGAALEGNSGIAVGNVVGSNIFNIAAILGIAAVVCPLAVGSGIVRRDLPVMCVCSVAFAGLLLFGGGLTRFAGALLVAALGAYIWWSLATAARAQPPPADAPASQSRRPGRQLLWSCVMVIAGLALLVFGARTFVEQAVAIARRLSVDEAVIGLTIVAAGTSMPELATSVVAALRGKVDMAIGNVVGSNIFNILGIAGLTALISPVGSGGVGWRDLAVMVALALLLTPLMLSGRRIVRWEGVLLLAGFAGYLWMVWPK